MASQQTGHVFISYAREDQAYARRLADNLRERGFGVWMDDRIDFGDRWWREIVRAVRASAAFIVVMTPDSEDSEWVEREILLAHAERKPIFPLLLRGKVNPLLITVQYADLTPGQMPSDDFYERLVQVAPCESKVKKRPSARQVQPTQTSSFARQPIAEPQVVAVEREPFEPELILIPAGEFLMGSDPKKDKDAHRNEQPQHRLYLPDYYIAKTPVTNAEYLTFVEATSQKPPKRWKKGRPPKSKEDHPVVYVTWDDAVAYCKWLTETTGRSYRLPSEAEWEKAARGTDGRIYPWGDRWDAKRCNTREGGLGDTTPVGMYSPQGDSPYGCVDMAGNVWEWCATRWGKSYPCDVTEDEWSEKYFQEKGVRVLRGGSWLDFQDGARCAFRRWDLPSFRNVDYGYRLVSPI
jgi:formylglycine-generating enzyme required for sulfatase activity